MINPNKICCGCTACVHACPQGAIYMQEDDEGFTSPVINQTLCIECHKCISICPTTNPLFNSASEECFACINTDEDARFNSSSGAVFPLLADYILNKNGYVCGAAVDRDLVTRHIYITNNNRHDISRLFGSKYVQSDLGNVFVKIKQWLNQKKYVLFSGTPCQVAGLKNFLSKDFENLLTVDIICHGVPSPGIFKLYLQEVCKQLPTIKNLSFRDKTYGWRSVKLTLRDSSGRVVLGERLGSNPYLKAFQQTAILRSCCHQCPFTRVERTSDITLGDFWKIETLSKTFSDNLGTSLVICNTALGKKIFDNISTKLSKIEKFSIAEVKKFQGNLRRPTVAHPLRERVFELYRYYSKYKDTNTSFSHELSRLFIPIGILNFFDADNFGAVLVPYALSKLVLKCGYHAEIINLRKRKNREDSSIRFEKFREQFLPLSPEGYDIGFLKSVLHRYKTIITGSDQVFRMRNTGIYMLNWVAGYKNMISYAASFGTSEYTGSIPPEEAANLLKRFDSLSVREKEGIAICKNFGINATQVLDPVIMLDALDYQSVIDSEQIEIPHKEYIGCIFLGEMRKKLFKDKLIASDIKAKYPLINVVREKDGTLRSIPEYLALIKNSKYILTNSFHGLVLSIIFKKKFITVINLDPSRQQSLLMSLGISLKRLITSLDKINLKILEEELDYNAIYIRLAELRRDSLKFLLNALENHYPLKETIPVKRTLQIQFGEKTLSMNISYKDNKKIYSIPEFNTEYSISFSSGKCCINDIAIEKRHDANICNTIFTLLEKKKENKCFNIIKKLNNELLRTAPFFEFLHANARNNICTG